MTPAPVSVIYSQDPELVRRARGFLRTASLVRHVNDADRIGPVLQQAGPCVLMIDLRSKDSRDLIDQIQNEQPDVLIIPFRVPQSETLREREEFGIYAAEEIDVERRQFQALLTRAFDYLKVAQENRDRRETSTMTPPPSRQREPAIEPSETTRTLPWLRFPRVLRRLENVDAL